MHTTLNKNVSAIGEEIGLELGQELVHAYQTANANATHYFEIGRQIIDQILAQPGCEGMRFYKAYNEMGEETLVYVGLDAEGSTLLEFTTINNQGLLQSNKGIVADRTTRGGGGSRDGGDGLDQADADNWNWTID